MLLIKTTWGKHPVIMLTQISIICWLLILVIAYHIFYECRPSVNRLFTSKADPAFQEWHRKENVWIIMFFSRIPFCLLHLSTCLTDWVYDQELGLYWLNRVQALLLIPCGSLICTASADFICWNCAFDNVICFFLDLDSLSAQFFQTRLQ